MRQTRVARAQQGFVKRDRGSLEPFDALLALERFLRERRHVAIRDVNRRLQRKRPTRVSSGTSAYRVRQCDERGTYHELVDLVEEGALVRSLNLETSVLGLDVRDIVVHELHHPTPNNRLAPNVSIHGQQQKKQRHRGRGEPTRTLS